MCTSCTQCNLMSGIDNEYASSHAWYWLAPPLVLAHLIREFHVVKERTDSWLEDSFEKSWMPNVLRFIYVGMSDTTYVHARSAGTEHLGSADFGAALRPTHVLRRMHVQSSSTVTQHTLQNCPWRLVHCLLRVPY